MISLSCSSLLFSQLSSHLLKVGWLGALLMRVGGWLAPSKVSTYLYIHGLPALAVSVFSRKKSCGGGPAGIQIYGQIINICKGGSAGNVQNV